MGPFKRAQRVGIMLRNAIATIILNDVKNPHIGFVTVTEVQLSADLRSAKVYITVLGSEEERDRTLLHLKKSIAFIKEKLRSKVALKYMPELQFRYDPSLDTGTRIDEIIKKIKQEDQE